MEERLCKDEAATRVFASEIAGSLREGDVVLLEGPLGAGKTTFVKGILEAFGYHGIVRSPTFNLLQEFDTNPKILHADLYRLPSAAGLGLEEYLETHLCLIEWPDRLGGLLDPTTCWSVRIGFTELGRTIQVDAPTQRSQS